jgi:hypothetical protein
MQPKRSITFHSANFSEAGNFASRISTLDLPTRSFSAANL